MTIKASVLTQAYRRISNYIQANVGYPEKSPFQKGKKKRKL